MSRRVAAPAPADRERLPPERAFAAGLANHHVCNTAYPIAHQRTWRPYRVPRARTDEVAASAWRGVEDLGLYLHVPFCETRCSFCEYTVVPRSRNAEISAHVDDLLREIALVDERIGLAGRRFHGFDVGGGTPAMLPGDELARLVEAIASRCTFAEGSDWSIETTPGLAAEQPERLAAYRRLGFERISMGLQVIEPDLLRVLNRSAHGVEVHHRAVENLRAAGFERFNVDLMYGFAGQSPESWRATLEHAISLAPEAITLYRMRYKLTRISHQAPSVTLDDVRVLSRLSKRVLREAGYHANPGKTTWSKDPQDVGTSSYLARRVGELMPYLGLGLGAQSFSPTTISYNDGAAGKALEPHRRSLDEGRLPIQDLHDLPEAQLMGKACAVSFYFGEIDHLAFARRFGRPLGEAFAAETAWLEERGFMEWTPRSFRLTEAGCEVVNGVMALFHAPSIQRYLADRDPVAAQDLHRNRRAAIAVAERG